MNKRGPKSKYSLVIPQTLNEETMYWLGFLSGDGSIRPRDKKNHARVRLEIQSGDREHLEQYRRWLRSTHPIRDSAKNCCIVEIQSQEYAEWLQTYNIVPRKTLTFRATSECARSRDYWRGLIDADGSITTNGGNRPAIELNGTKDICEQFLTYSKRVIESTASPRQKSENCWAIKFADKQARQLIAHLYQDNDIALKRKMHRAVALRYDTLPHVATNIAVFDLDDNIPYILLTQRAVEPFKGQWCLPGGFVGYDEELEECAARELFEETGLDLDPNDLRQAFAVGRKVRDPRTRIISVVYTTVVDRYEQSVCADDDAEQVAWFRIDDLPSLAADHLETIRRVLGGVYNDPC